MAKIIRKNWYAGFILGKAGVKTISKIEIFFPKIRCWQPSLKKVIYENGIKIIKEETMFDNYVFLQMSEGNFSLKREIVEKTPIVYFLEDCIRDEEVFHLSLMQSMRTLPKPKNWIGEDVRIVKGPYKEFEGKCVNIVGNFAVVELNMHDIEIRKVKFSYESIRLIADGDDIKIDPEEGGEYIVTKR